MYFSMIAKNHTCQNVQNMTFAKKNLTVTPYVIHPLSWKQFCPNLVSEPPTESMKAQLVPLASYNYPLVLSN